MCAIANLQKTLPLDFKKKGKSVGLFPLAGYHRLLLAAPGGDWGGNQRPARTGHIEEATPNRRGPANPLDPGDAADLSAKGCHDTISRPNKLGANNRRSGVRPVRQWPRIVLHANLYKNSNCIAVSFTATVSNWQVFSIETIINGPETINGSKDLTLISVVKIGLGGCLGLPRQQQRRPGCGHCAWPGIGRCRPV